MKNDINLDLFVAYALGELDDRDHRRLQQHLAAAPDDAGTLARIERVVHALNSRDVQELPKPLRSRLQALFAAHRPAQPSWIETAAQAVLTLLLDTRLAPARGFRSWTDDAFLLTFAGPSISVDLQVSPTRARTGDVPGRWALRGCAEADGQIQPVEVAVLAGGGPAVFTASDEHGQFALEVPQGACSLALNTGDHAFTTPPFDIP